MYGRRDGAFEVFHVKIRPEGEVFGKVYPEREVYPGNEDFGQSAWCFTTLESATKRFRELTSTERLYTPK